MGERWHFNWNRGRPARNAPQARSPKAFRASRSFRAGRPRSHQTPAPLETESKLQLSYAARKCAERAAKIAGVSEISIAAPTCLEGRQIENVEGVKEIRAHFKIRSLTQVEEVWQSRPLNNTEID